MGFDISNKIDSFKLDNFKLDKDENIDVIDEKRERLDAPVAKSLEAKQFPFGQAKKGEHHGVDESPLTKAPEGGSFLDELAGGEKLRLPKEIQQFIKSTERPLKNIDNGPTPHNAGEGSSTPSSSRSGELSPSDFQARALSNQFNAIVDSQAKALPPQAKSPVFTDNNPGKGNAGNSPGNGNTGVFAGNAQTGNTASQTGNTNNVHSSSGASKLETPQPPAVPSAPINSGGSDSTAFSLKSGNPFKTPPGLEKKQDGNSGGSSPVKLPPVVNSQNNQDNSGPGRVNTQSHLPEAGNIEDTADIPIHDVEVHANDSVNNHSHSFLEDTLPPDGLIGRGRGRGHGTDIVLPSQNHLPGQTETNVDTPHNPANTNNSQATSAGQSVEVVENAELIDNQTEIELIDTNQVETTGVETSNEPTNEAQLSDGVAETSFANEVADLSTNIKSLVIAQGQSLEQVANELGVDVFELLRANPQLLSDPSLFAGQQITMPAGEQHIIDNLADNGLANMVKTDMTDPNKKAVGGLKQTLSELGGATLEKTSANLTSEKPFAIFQQRFNGMAATGRLSGNNQSAPSVTINTSFSQTANLNGARGLSGQNLGLPNIGLEKRTEKAEHQNNKIDKMANKPQDVLAPGFSLVNAHEIELEISQESESRGGDLNIPQPFDEWAGYIYQAAEKYGLEAAMIASVIWCESAGKNMIGKDGHGYGLMQIDDRKYKQWLEQNQRGMNPETNIDFGAAILRANIDHFRGKQAAGIAAFDCSIDAVEEALILGKSVDYFTSGGNYSLRVLTQTDYFRRFFGKN